jgi:aminopeptidase
VLIDYSLALRAGERLLIATQRAAVPLAREAYRCALRAGAYPVASFWMNAYPMGHLTLDGLFDIRLAEGSQDQLDRLLEIDRHQMEIYDAYLFIQAEDNTRALSGVDPARIARIQQTQSPVRERFYERDNAGELRWCFSVFPTHAHAQDAGMSLADYEGFVYAAGHLHEEDPVARWQAIEREQQRVVDFLSRHDEIHILASDTDLSYRVGGRRWINSCGRRNFPDGEVFTSPIEESVNGTVRFSYPAIFAGTEAEGVSLTFRDGQVVEASAARGEEFLKTMLDQDAGARRVGEVAFGLNYHVQQFTGSILFDEKIGGTMHLALGRAYRETGGTNHSAIHWDMICDMRQGQVYADGQLCYAAGRFLDLEV